MKYTVEEIKKYLNKGSHTWLEVRDIIEDLLGEVTRLNAELFEIGCKMSTLNFETAKHQEISNGIIEQALQFRDKVQKLELERLRKQNGIYERELTRLRDCDWVVSLPDRMDAVRKIASEALAEAEKVGEE